MLRVIDFRETNCIGGSRELTYWRRWKQCRRTALRRTRRRNMKGRCGRRTTGRVAAVARPPTSSVPDWSRTAASVAAAAAVKPGSNRENRPQLPVLAAEGRSRDRFLQAARHTEAAWRSWWRQIDALTSVFSGLYIKKPQTLLLEQSTPTHFKRGV